MTCRSCRSNSQKEFGSEILIHHRGLKNLDKPPAWTFPKLLICFDCGYTEFTVPEAELRLLREGGAESTAARSVR